MQKYKINLYYKSKKKENIIIQKYMICRYDDIINQIIDNLSKRATKSLKKYNIRRNYEHMELIGCSKEGLRTHLEVQFTSNMSYDNYGDWEIDHIKPISRYNFSNKNEILECFNYKNLQPLWKEDNRRKGNKICD